MTKDQLEARVKHLENLLRVANRQAEAALAGAVEVPVLTPGQLAELRVITERLQVEASAVKSLSDSVASWMRQLERFEAPSSSPEVTPTT